MLLGFPSNETAGDCVAGIISAGIIPAGIEMMDEFAIKAAEDFVHAGYPVDCPALVLTELDGPEGEVAELIEQVRGIAVDCRASFIRVSESEEERVRIWAGRKAAFPALGDISPDYYCMDGTIPAPRTLARTDPDQGNVGQVRTEGGERVSCRRR